MKPLHPVLAALGPRVQFFRMKSKLTQKQLAERCEVDTAHVCLIETGRRLPSIRVVCRLADALEVEPAVFFQNNVNVEI